MGDISGLSSLGGIASGLGSLFGGGGGSSGSGQTAQTQAPSDQPVDTPGAYQDPTASVGQNLQDLVQQQGDVQDPEITARQDQQKQQQAPAPIAPQNDPGQVLSSPQQLAQLAAHAMGAGGQAGNAWQLSAPQGMNPLTQNLTNLAGQIPVRPGAVAHAPTAVNRIAASPLPAPRQAAASAGAPVTTGGRGGGAYGQISGAAQPNAAAALASQLPPPSTPDATITAGGPGAGAGQALQAPTALAPASLAQAAQANQARKSAQASNFAGQEHDPTIPRSGTPGLDQIKSRIASLDTGNAPNGGYFAIGRQTINRRGVSGQGIGKYQIMSYNVGPWTQRFLGQRMTPHELLRNPQAQDRLANAVLKHLYNQYGNWRDVASVWMSGVPAYQAQRGPDAARVRQFEQRITG